VPPRKKRKGLKKEKRGFFHEKIKGGGCWTKNSEQRDLLTEWEGKKWSKGDNLLFK